MTTAKPHPKDPRSARDITGAPATVLLSLMFLARPADLDELAYDTGHDIPTVRRALRRLEQAGLVRRTSDRLWELTDPAQ